MKIHPLRSLPPAVAGRYLFLLLNGGTAREFRLLEYGEAIVEMPVEEFTPETVYEGGILWAAALLSADGLVKLGRQIITLFEMAPNVDTLALLAERANEFQALLMPLAIRAAFDAARQGAE